jgi:outer membrane protein
MVGLLAMPAMPARASDWADIATSPWQDPLLTRPPVLDMGSALPGDTDPAPCPSGTDDFGTSPLTLAVAVDLALCHNPQLQGTWAAIKVQAAAVGEARAAYLPTLTMSASVLKDRTEFPGSKQAPTVLRNDTRYATLAWRLFDFGGRDANRRSANALLRAAILTYDAGLQKTLTSVIGAYFDAQTALATWQAKQTNEELARKTSETAQRREGRGAGAQTDTLQAATALAKASLEKGRAEGAYQRALAVLVYSLGEPAKTHVTLAAELDDPDGSANGVRQDLDSWLMQAQAQHPAIAAARAQLEAAREKVVSVRSEGLPTLDLTGNYFQNGRPNQGLTPIDSRETLIGVTLTIPLFEGFARTYKVRGAQAQVEHQEAALADTEQQVSMEVVKAHADASSAIANLSASETLSKAAQEALESVQRKFARGATDILDILNAQSALSDARQERIRCLAEWRSAKLRLLAASGVLGRQAVGT